MDPNANLAEQRQLAAKILRQSDHEQEISQNDAIRLAELVQALDGWIVRKGFLPKAWREFQE